MLGFENTFTIEKDNDTYGTVKQEVRVIDGSIFLAHWHIKEQYWSYDQLSRELMKTDDFSNEPKKELLLSIWDNLEDVILSINQLRTEGNCLEKLECGDLTIKHKKTLLWS